MRPGLVGVGASVGQRRGRDAGTSEADTSVGQETRGAYELAGQGGR